jgi:signal recognition particle receptor subunit beta
MGFLNLKTGELQLKIVYYGPGRGGKTTNLLYIHNNFRQKTRTEMVNISTYGDRTLFFDFFPFHLGKIGGFDVKVQLYTVPGQAHYTATRRLVLRGADGIVFVADVTKSKRRQNIAALRDLQKNLRAHKKNIFHTPIVFQYNKVDLAENGIATTPHPILNQDLNRQLRKPFFPASALMGKNVANTLKTIITMTTADIKRQLN